MEQMIKVTVCFGTACYVMGGSDLLLLDEQIPEAWKARVQIEGSPCLNLCMDKKNGKAPFVDIDGEIVSQAAIPDVLRILQEKIEA